MGGAAEFPERASSPLKRRASSMDPEASAEKTEDVDMIPAPAAAPTPCEAMVTENSEANVAEENKDANTAPQVEAAETREEEMTEGARPPASIEAHIKSIVALWQEMEESPIKDSDEAYVVSKQWVHSAVGDVADIQHGKFSIPEAESLAPVDNSDIILEVLDDPTVGNTAPPTKKHFVRLKPGLTNLADFLYFPPTAWELLMQWPGLKEGQIPIIRTAHDTSVDEFRTNVQYELYPPVFTIHRLWSANSTIPIKQILKTKNPPAVRLARSRCTPYKTLLAQAKQQTDIDLKWKVRVWRVPPKLLTGAPATSSGPTPPASPDNNVESTSAEEGWDKLLVDVETFLKLEKDVDRFKVEVLGDVTAEPKYNGHADLAKVELGADQAIVLDEQIQGIDYVSNFSPSKASERLAPVRSSSASLAVTQSTRSGRSSPAPSGPVTRGRARKSGRQLGCVGLNNLGNTCYMNAALQCVRSVEELTKYFLSHEWEKEINRENVLAHNGDVAQAYARLLDEIYKDPPPNSVTPRQFKNVIGRYAPAFSGYGQQDSQEFLGFLLDGLQEDLSRIKKKPYIEKPDSTDDMINNPVAIREMADKVWDITKRRDDSVIADLFTGLYKSTLVCPDPECAKVSITFDPFTNLTLPLPVENKWSHTVKFFPLNDKAIDIRVELDKTSSMRKLKEFVSSRTGVPVERLHGAEEWKGKFYKQYSNGASVHEEISVNDNAWVFELEAAPTNWNTAEARKLENATKGRIRSLVDEAEPPNPSVLEKMLVPVIHRRPSSPRGHFSTHRWEFACLPYFIILDPEESRNEDAIRRKILQKIATFSKHEVFAHQDELETSGSSEPELVGASGSEFGSSEGKVVAQSVEGEEDMVDVTMKDASDSKTVGREVPLKSQSTKYAFNRTTPPWVNPREYLPPELQNMFEMSFFTEAGPLVVSGMNGVDEGKEYPKLSSRIPDNTHSDDALDNATNGTASNEEDSSDELSRPSADSSASQTRMTEESDDDDEPPVVRSVKIPHRPKTNPRTNGGRKKMKSYKNYGKKGNKRREREARKQTESDFLDVQTPPESEDSLADGGPLIRLREGIIVDWSEDAYNELFGEGRATWEHCDTLPDPELDKAQQARQRRRKNGISLEHCLDEFEREEVLSEQDTWYCPRCKRHQRATKKFDLWKTPDILVVHLKRFSSSGFRRDKLEVLVEFPLEGLDLTSRVQNREDGKEEIYDLIGVDCHWGGLGGGHYTAHAKNFVDDQWYSYNDSSVSKASAERVVDSSAYLLFYRRRSSQPLGGPRFKAIVEAFDDAGSDDDDLAGEGQRLGEGSSQIGSSSAFQERGAGATPLHPIAARGGSLLSRSTIAYETQSDDGLPAISDMRFDNRPVQKSVEEDEGIDMTETDTQTHTNLTGNWSFENINTLSTPGGNDVSAFASDAASDEAQHDSSGDERAVSPRPTDFDADTDMDVPGMGHYELGHGAQPDGELPAYVEPPPPEYQGEVTRDDITWAQNQKVLNVQPTADDQRSEEAAEIRLDDEDEKL